MLSAWPTLLASLDGSLGRRPGQARPGQQHLTEVMVSMSAIHGFGSNVRDAPGTFVRTSVCLSHHGVHEGYRKDASR